MTFDRHLLRSHADVVRLCERISRAPVFGFDTEGSGPNLVSKPSGKKSMLDVHRSNLTGLSFAFDDGHSCYVPVDHKRGDENVPLRSVHLLYEALRESRATAWIHNLDHELHQLGRPPVPATSLLSSLRSEARAPGARPRWRDTILLAWLLNLNPVGGYGLKTLAPKFLGVEMTDFATVTQGRDFDQLRPKEGLDYACEDAECALLLAQKYVPELEADDRLREWFETVESPFVWLVNDMEREGLVLDQEQHESTVQYLRERQKAALERWNDRLGMRGVSPTSSQQLQILYDSLVWPTEHGAWTATKTASGYSTDKAHKEKMVEICPPGSLGREAAEAVMDVSASTKLLGSYGPKLALVAGSHADGRFRDSFKQGGTKTGRLTSSVLLLVPKHSEDGKRIRESFVAPEGRTFVAGDFSQVELRVLAHFSRRGALFDGFHAGVDPHTATADAMGKPRPYGKTGNFLIVYGGGPGKASASLGISLEEARVLLDDVNSSLAVEVATLDRAEDTARKTGKVRTIGGRYRTHNLWYLEKRKRELYRAGKRWDDEDEVYKKACARVGSEKRMARNGPIQGSAADITKVACLRTWREMDESRCSLVLQIHDDILLAPTRDYADEAAEILERNMRCAWDLRVPLDVDIRKGDRWSDLK